jgi:hypothetical protein
MLVTPWRVLSGLTGDVCPEPATIGTTLPQPGRSATTVGVAVIDGQDGRQAFAVDRREVPP